MTETEHGKTTTWTVGEAIQVRVGTRWRNGRLEEIQIDNDTNEIRIGYSFHTDLTDRVHYVSIDKVRKHGELDEDEWAAYEKREKAKEEKDRSRGSTGQPPTSGPGRWKTDNKWEMKAWREKSARNKERYGKD